MRFVLFLGCVILALSNAASFGAPVTTEWAKAWQADLDFVGQELPQAHANLYHTVSAAEFDASLKLLRSRVPTLSHHEITVELAAIIASIGDGHTRLTLPMVDGSGFSQGHSTTARPRDTALLFHHYPIRLYIYDDGLYVQRIGSENSAYAAAKVVRIGNMSADDAMSAVRRVVHRDNEMQVQLVLPSLLVVPEVLHALGIIDDMQHAVFTVETNDTAEHEIAMTPVAENEKVAWVDANHGASQLPLYLQNTATNFWFEYVAEQRAVYWQYNEVYDQDDESIVEFATRLTDYLADNDVEILVIDLRFNSGGDNALNRSLLHALIRCPQVREPGSLYVIVGRGTFSAAMMFALDLEKHTNAIFIGEPTGARVNSYGDSRKVELPNTGLTIRASTLYWQYSDPRDERPWLEPHLSARLTSQDAVTGYDPALETIWELSRATPPNGSPNGDWRGRFMEYKIVVHLDQAENQWQATLDFPELEAMALPLINVSYQKPTLSFGFQNGDDVISFSGKIMGDDVVGSMQMQGQIHPWAARRDN